MSQIKILARESDFLASIFSKTFFPLFKTGGQALSTFFIHQKKLYLVSSKAENLYSKPFFLELWLLTNIVLFDYLCFLHLTFVIVGTKGPIK